MEQNEKGKSDDVKKQNNRRKKKLAILVFGLIGIIGVVILFFYLRYKATHITTDDAYVDGRIHTISARIKGSVNNIYVQDNQQVKRGDMLVEIDPADYDLKVSEAQSGVHAEKSRLTEVEARIQVAKMQMAEMKASIETARANLELQEAQLQQAEKDALRAENLFKLGTISKDRFEKTQTAHTVVLAQSKAAREQLKQAEKALETQTSVVKQAQALRASQLSMIREREARLDAAQLNYGYTKIYAPADGYITKKAVEVGNQVEVAQPLMAVVSLDDLWITANYKETQLEKVRPGQTVRFKVDTYSGRDFTGKVESIMSGTGAMFSLFPPENASGNYVKVVQRIPVKITIDKETDIEHLLRIGMSVVPTILIKE
jgi:membrane fusion protein (multidrug efflux system)